MTCRHYAVLDRGYIRCRDCGDYYDWTLDGARWQGRPTKAPASVKKPG